MNVLNERFWLAEKVTEQLLWNSLFKCLKLEVGRLTPVPNLTCATSSYATVDLRNSNTLDIKLSKFFDHSSWPPRTYVQKMREKRLLDAILLGCLYLWQERWDALVKVVSMIVCSGLNMKIYLLIPIFRKRTRSYTCNWTPRPIQSAWNWASHNQSLHLTRLRCCVYAVLVICVAPKGVEASSLSD